MPHGSKSARNVSVTPYFESHCPAKESSISVSDSGMKRVGGDGEMDWCCFSTSLLVGWTQLESEVVQRSTLSPRLPFILQFWFMIMIMIIDIIFIPGDSLVTSNSKQISKKGNARSLGHKG